MNNIQILGRLTADPETKNIGGNDLVTGTIAVSKKWKPKGENSYKEKTSFFEFKMWGRTGLAFAEYHSKGDLVLIEGELDQERWEDNDGKKRSKTLINADKWSFVGGKKQPQAEPKTNDWDDMGTPAGDDDIPF